MKSFVALWIAKKLKETGKIVLYFDLENPFVVVRPRYDVLGISDSTNFYYCGTWVEGDPGQFFTAHFEETYCELAKQLKPVMIFDSFNRFNPYDENDANKLAKVTNSFRKLTKLGATVIVIHQKMRLTLWRQL